jgi:hypothetical protein
MWLVEIAKFLVFIFLCLDFISLFINYLMEFVKLKRLWTVGLLWALKTA